MKHKIITNSKLEGINNNGARGLREPVHILGEMGKIEMLSSPIKDVVFAGYRIYFDYYFVELDEAGFIIKATKEKCLGYKPFRDITTEEANGLEAAIIQASPAVADLSHSDRMNAMLKIGFKMEMAKSFTYSPTNIVSYIDKLEVIIEEKNN